MGGGGSEITARHRDDDRAGGAGEGEELAVGVARDLFTIDGSAPELMRKKILRHGKKVGFINLIKDGMKGVTVL